MAMTTAAELREAFSHQFTFRVGDPDDSHMLSIIADAARKRLAQLEGDVVVVPDTELLGPLVARYMQLLDRVILILPENYPEGPKDLDGRRMTGRSFYILDAETYEQLVRLPDRGSE